VLINDYSAQLFCLQQSVQDKASHKHIFVIDLKALPYGCRPRGILFIDSVKVNVRLEKSFDVIPCLHEFES
jgi:hypothetical protein